jgi:hypothetical protein
VWISSVGSLVSAWIRKTPRSRAQCRRGGFVIGIAPDGGTVWAAVLEKQALLRVNARSLEVEQAIPLGAYPPWTVAASGPASSSRIRSSSLAHRSGHRERACDELPPQPRQLGTHGRRDRRALSFATPAASASPSGRAA